MIAAAIIGGLAGLWFWTVLNDEDGIAGPLNRLLQKNKITNKWMKCPWCSGAWFSLAASIAIYHPSVAAAIVTGFAAATICAIIATYTGD